MYVERVDVASGFDDLQWDNLVAASSDPNVFLTRTWCEAWSQYQADGGEDFLLVVRDATSRLVGLAPLVLRRNRFLGLRELNFMGTGDAAPDHLDLVADQRQRPEITTAICQYLCDHRRDWDVLRLTDLRHDSLTPSILRQRFGDNYLCQETNGATCPYLPLTGSWEEYLSQKSSNFRQQLRSRRRKFEKLPEAEFLICQTPEQVEESLACLFRFNPKRWAERGTRSAFSHQSFRDFHLQVARRFLSKDWLDLCCLKVKGQTVAVLYSFVFKGKVFYYNAGFDPCWSEYSVGRVLMAYHLERAFDRGLAEYDFLRGNHAYKYGWTSTQRCNRDVLVIRRHSKALAYDRLERSLKIARRTVKRHLPRDARDRLKQLLSSS